MRKKYRYEGIVQFDENGNPCMCGVSVMSLGFYEHESYFVRNAESAAVAFFELGRPEYKNYIQLL